MVDHVVKHLGHKFMPVPKRPMAMEERLKPLRQSLEQHSVVGLYGLGGTGKTTLANALYNQLKHGYVQSCCYVEVGQMAETAAGRILLLRECQKQIFQDICGLETPSHGMQQNRGHLEMLLQEARVLLVLDDIWYEDQLKSLLVQLLGQVPKSL